MGKWRNQELQLLTRKSTLETAWIQVLCCVCAKLLLSCLTLCDPMDLSPPGSSVNGILQARILEWVAIPFSRVLKLGLLHCRQILNHLNHQGRLGCLLLKGRGELEVGIMVSFQHTSLSLHEINFLAWHK